MQAHTLAIIQARMGSSRLPGKVMLDIAGQPMLGRVVKRASRAETVDAVMVATTTDPEDQAIANFCAEHGFPCYRGSQHDVLDRYYQAACSCGAEVIVRITADCPMIDSGVIDDTVSAFLGKAYGTAVEANGKVTTVENHLPSGTLPVTQNFPYDFAANRLPPPWGRTYPIGLDTEVCSFTALERAWKEAEQPYQREHVMPYLYEGAMRLQQKESGAGDVPSGYPPLFRILLINHEPDYGSLRWTVDTPEDLDLVRRVYAYFHGRDNFTWLEVLDLLRSHPELAQINAQVQHKKVDDFDRRVLEQKSKQAPGN